MRAIVLLCAVLLPAAEYHNPRCYYADQTTEITAPCTLRSTEIDGHPSYVMHIGDKYAVIQYVEHNGPDYVWILNDQLAIGHSDGDEVQGFTLNGSIRLEFATQGDDNAHFP